MSPAPVFLWLASYPKSGNTWLRLLLQSCLEGGVSVPINGLWLGAMAGLDRAAFDEDMGVAAADLTEDEVLAWRPAALRAAAARVQRPLHAKTHAAQRRLPSGEWLHPPDVTLAAVVLVRDPRDVALSLARHIGREVDYAIALMAEPGCRRARSLDCLRPQLVDPWSSWSANVESWLDAPGIPVTLIRYEDLRVKTEAALPHILAALGHAASAETVRAAVTVSRLGRLRAQEATGGFREWQGQGSFFGEGRTGGWRERMTAAQAARIEADHGPLMRRLGYLD